VLPPQRWISGLGAWRIRGVKSMNTEQTPERRPSEPGSSNERALLTRQDVDRLTAYKWRYSLESHGFSAGQATRLLFIKWLYARGAVGG
jgi:hypothetical protein